MLLLQKSKQTKHPKKSGLARLHCCRNWWVLLFGEEWLKSKNFKIKVHFKDTFTAIKFRLHIPTFLGGTSYNPVPGYAGRNAVLNVMRM